MAARHAATRTANDSHRGSNSRRPEWARGLGALLLLLTLLVGIPAVLIAATGVPFAHGLPTFTHLADRFRGPDDGQLLLDALVCLAWAGWAAFTLTSAAETLALDRHTVAPTLLGLAGLQPAVGRLIAAVALLLPASGAALHLGAGAVQPRPALTAPVRPAATATRAAANHTVVSAVAISEVLPVYVVGSDPTGERDTLWSIAARHLGDPLRWHDIAQLNYGQRQADGAIFTDPNLIRPGWTLRLPADATGLPGTREPTRDGHHGSPVTPTDAHATHRAEPPLTTVPAPVVAPPDPSPAPAQGTPSTTTPPASSEAAPAVPPSGRTGAAVQLGAGSEISAALAAALLLGFPLRRLRRRQHYQPRPPHPGQFAAHRSLPPPPLRQLLAQTPGPRDVIGFMSGPLSNASPPGSWQLGTRDEDPVHRSWEQNPVLSFSGPGAASVLRACVVAALIDSRTGTDILAVGEIFSTLFPEQPMLAGVKRLDSRQAALPRLQAEVLSRSRLLADADLPNAAAYRAHNPEDPLPALLLLTDQGLADQPALLALLQANTHLDIVALALNDDERQSQLHGIRVAATGDVLAAEPAINLSGVRLYRLTDSDAATLLWACSPVDKRDTIPQARTDAATDIDWTAAAAAPSAVLTPDAPPAAGSATADVSRPVNRPPIRVQLLGPIRIWVHDVEIVTGLRRAGRELLAWYLLHPEGRPIEAAVEALWPNDDPSHGRQRFWNALNSLRARLRSAGDDKKLQVLGKSGDNYQPPTPEFEVDLWTFQAALQAAARASEPDDKLTALQRAVDSYTGPFADGTDFLWVEPIRAECHRRALDAHVGYATLAAEAGQVEQAISTLEGALKLDPYAEDLYRRLMRLHHSIGRKESVRLLWKQLDARLLDIDRDPEDETRRVYRQCL